MAEALSPPGISVRRQVILLGLILAVAAFVRFYNISAAHQWLDEIWSIEMARGQGSLHDELPVGVIRTDQPEMASLIGAPPWWSIWSHLLIVIHPPLYFIALRWWMDIFGTSAVATRTLSAAESLAAIVVFFDVCRLLHGPRIGLMAAAVMALAIAQIHIAQEARSYPQMILLALACADLLVRIDLSGAEMMRLVLLVVALAAVTLTHYLAAGAVGALGLYAILRLRGRNRSRVIIAFLISGLLVLILWGNQMHRQTQAFPTFSPTYLREHTPDHLTQTFRRVATLPMQYLIGQDLSGKIGWPICAVVAALFLIPIARARSNPKLLLWVLWLLCVIGMMGAIDLAHQSKLLFEPHYSVLASPAVYTLLAAGFDWPRLGRFRATVPVVVMIFMAGCVAFRLQNPQPAPQDFQLLSEIIDRNAMPDEPLIFYNDSWISSPGLWLMCYKYYSPDSHHPWVTLREPASAKLLSQLGHWDELWMIGGRPEIDGPKILPGWRLMKYWQTSAGGAAILKRGPAVH